MCCAVVYCEAGFLDGSTSELCDVQKETSWVMLMHLPPVLRKSMIVNIYVHRSRRMCML